jgi:PAS domain S-box-containing protein
VLFNRAAEEITGKAAEEVLGHDDFVLFPEEEAGLVIARDRRVVEAMTSLTFDEAVTGADGQQATFSSIKGPIRNSAGNVTGIFGISRDISARKREEEAVREAALRLRLALDSAHLGAWDWDIRTGKCIWDVRMCELHGLPAEHGEVAYQAWEQCVHPEDREGAVQALTAAVEGRGEYDLEYRVIHPDGSVRHIKTNGLLLRDADGAPLRMIGLDRDVTEQHEAESKRARLEAQFHQAQRMESVGRLAGGIAHDFNNLLTPVLGFAHLLRRQASGEQLDMIDSIIKASQSAANLTAQLLAYSGKANAPASRLDVSRHIAGMRELLRTSASGNIEMLFDLPSASPAIVADASRISQIVMNLVQNAVEAIGADTPGCVTVKVSTVNAAEGAIWNEAAGRSLAAGTYVALQVSDNGRGMTTDVRRQAFEPFFTTNLPGRGLGLAAVSGICNALGGGVRVESAPDAGSVFTVYLPVAPLD